ncbi:unnamed protein product [Parascedosporium putredinis]|uniref:CSN8/PSMD8/EIF3K domain-containing protein n=1 Tax=Parascedosporium putredinis TaxID=1442378 RepID=A0A9P1M8P8_9PEZI|nr:unnamed protein product [Parascedosporium putredinis]CAI7989342.1 unnamed protein product [Parascedosporium putredinis]
MPSRGGRSSSNPWGRLKAPDQDPLEIMGLPSKGDTRLLDFKTQERYYTKIVERYMSFCSDSGQRDELLRRFASLNLDSGPGQATAAAPAPTIAHGPGGRSAMAAVPPPPVTMAATSNTKALSDVMMALRKLREGIVASKRADDFSVQSLTSLEFQEVVGYLVLDAACRRGDLAEAYGLRRRYGLRDGKVLAVLKALTHDNYIAFGKIKDAVDGHKVSLMELAEPELRVHTLKCFGRGYLSVDKTFLERSTSSGWESLTSKDGVGWQLDGDKVIIRKIKAR